MSATLTDWQIEIDDLVLGYGTSYRMFGMDHDKPDVASGGDDLQMPNEDGLVFARNYLGGTVITFDFGLATTDAAAAVAMMARLRRAWQADVARLSTRTVVPLRYKLPGQATRCVFGRPRKFTPADLSTAEAGYIPVTCDFQCVDHRFYSDVEHSLALSLLPALSDGGLSSPIDCPISLAPSSSSRADVVTNAGDAPAFLVAEFHGPVGTPALEWTATGVRTGLSSTLAFDQTSTTDARPWARTVLRQDGASLAGYLTGPKLAELTFPPGASIVAFRGSDLTGGSYCVVRWRDTYSSL